MTPLGSDTSQSTLKELTLQIRLEAERLEEKRRAALTALAFIDQMPMPAWIKLLENGKLRMARVNSAWHKCVGTRLLAVPSQADFLVNGDFFDEENQDWHRNDLTVLQTGQPIVATEVSRYADGTVQVWKVYKWPIRHDTEIIGVCGLGEEQVQP